MKHKKPQEEQSILRELDFDDPGIAELEEEMNKINADIDRFLEQAKRDNEAFLKEIDLANSLKFDVPDIDDIFKV